MPSPFFTSGSGSANSPDKVEVPSAADGMLSLPGVDLEGGVGGGGKSGGLGDRSPPVGSRGEAQAGGLGDGVPQKLEHFFKSTQPEIKGQVKMKGII